MSDSRSDNDANIERKADERPELPGPTWLWFRQAVEAVHAAISPDDDPNSGADAELLADLADGRLWAEGIEVGREPPEYVRISEAWWAGAQIRYDRPAALRWATDPVGRTIVYSHFSIARRRTSREYVIEYRSVRILTEQVEKLYPALDVEEVMRRAYLALGGIPGLERCPAAPGECLRSRDSPNNSTNGPAPPPALAEPLAASDLFAGKPPADLPKPSLRQRRALTFPETVDLVRGLGPMSDDRIWKEAKRKAPPGTRVYRGPVRDAYVELFGARRIGRQSHAQKLPK
jgi:hypothetical protein